MAPPKKKSKEITGYLKVTPPAGSATPSPPLGPALGQRGLNIKEFTDTFNKATEGMEKGSPVPTVITIYADKSFTFVVKTPPASYLLCKAASINKGGGLPGREIAGQVSIDKIREIAELKLKDLNANDVDAAMKIIEGSAKSMGLQVQK